VIDLGLSEIICYEVFTLGTFTEIIVRQYSVPSGKLVSLGKPVNLAL
jgi:hypothetical protein